MLTNIPRDVNDLYRYNTCSLQILKGSKEIHVLRKNKKILLRYTFSTYDLKLFKRLTDVKCGIDYDLLVIGISPL